MILKARSHILDPGGGVLSSSGVRQLAWSSVLFCLPATARSEIVFSGGRNIAIAQDFDGVYINVDLENPDAVVSASGDWDLNPFFSGMGIANSPDFQPVRGGVGNEDAIIRIGAAALIDATATFSSDWGGSGSEGESGHIGPGALQFADGKPGYIGFRLDRGGGVWYYGWMRVVLTANGSNGIIQSWAYENSGAAILAGATGQARQQIVAGNAVPVNVSGAADSILLASSGKVSFDGGTTGADFAGTIDGEGEIVISGAGGLRLGGANSFTGTATVEKNSKLIVADSTNLGSASVVLGNSSALVFQSAASSNGESNTFSNTISLNGSGGVMENNGTGTVEVTGAVGGYGALTKKGSGSLTLSGINTYTGATSVSQGRLTVAAESTINTTSGVLIGAGEFNYNSLTPLTQNVSFSGTGGILSGSGTINTTVNVTAANTLSIGNSPGTMYFDSDLGIEGTYYYELVGGTASGDLGIVAGDLTLGGILDLVQLGTYTDGDKFTLLTYGGSLTGIFTDASLHGLVDDSIFTAAGGFWRINYDDTVAGLNGGTKANFVTITAIPEPSAAALLGFGIMGLLACRHRAGLSAAQPLSSALPPPGSP